MYGGSIIPELSLASTRTTCPEVKEIWEGSSPWYSARAQYSSNKLPVRKVNSRSINYLLLKRCIPHSSGQMQILIAVWLFHYFILVRNSLYICTKEDFGTSCFILYREVVLSLKVKYTREWTSKHVLYQEVFSIVFECPLSEVLQCISF